MPEATIAPTATPAPASAPSAAPSRVPANAPAAKRTPTPASTIPVRDDQGRFVKGHPSVTPKLPEPPKVSVAKALGLKNKDKDPFKAAQGLIDKARAELKTNSLDLPLELPPAAESPAAPVGELPAEPPAVTPPAAPAPAPAAVAPAAPAKVKLGDKEYTPEELQAHLQELERFKAPQPPKFEEPQSPPPPAPPSAEEIARRQQEFINQQMASLEAPLTETELDTLLAGGQQALQVLEKVRKRDMATAIMTARMGIAEGLNPILQGIFRAMEPMVQQHEQVQRYSVEQQFLAKHRDFAPHLERARQVAEELYRRYPQQVSRMTAEQFVDEVARQTDLILTDEYKRWYPSANTTWRDAAKQAMAPAPQPAPIPAPAPAPAAKPVPKPRPPAPTVPQGSATGAAPSWDSVVARSMRPR